MGDAASADLAPPQRYVVPKPSGDPDAARHLASAYDACADALVAQVRIATDVLDRLGSAWRGTSAHAAQEPERVLTEDALRVAHALRQSASDLRHYAHKLQHAHQHHGWSIGRLVTLGALVTVGVAAVVVTVGAAAPAEAAAAAAAVETAEAATAAAGTASATAASSLAGWQALLIGVRPLAPFVVPHLVSAGASVGIESLSELIAGQSLDLHSLEVAAAVGFAGSSVGGTIEKRLVESPTVLRRLAEGGIWAANGTAGGYADGDEFDPVDSLAFGLTGLVARDVRVGVDQTRLMWKLRVPTLPLGFASRAAWRKFVTTMYDGLDKAGYRDAVVAFRGSSVTGVSYTEGWGFDSHYRSDWDLALADGRALRRALNGGLSSAGRGTRTAPLKEIEHLRLMGLVDVTATLNDMFGRNVEWMIYLDRDAVVGRNQPFIFIPRP
jgi:uncharacterized protein YukE